MSPASSATARWNRDSPDLLLHGDNLAALRALPEASMQLVYLDPPFNTGRTQRRATTRSTRVLSASMR